MENSETSTQQKTATTPSLVSPREAAVVNGNEVTFVWNPVDRAEGYLLQVAATAQFDEPAAEQVLNDQTAVTLADFFPTDNQTFFWRVLAKHDGEWHGGETIESFVAASAEDAERHLAGPQVDEDMGPVTELVRAAKQDVTSSMLDSESRFEREKEMGVAYEGIPAGQIMAIAVSILLVVAVAVVVLISWFGQVTQQTAMGAVNPDRYTTLQEAELDAARQLEQYDVVNEEEGVYRIPIDRAIEIIANEEYQRGQAGDESSTE